MKIADFPFMPIFVAALTHLFDVGISFSLGVKIFHTLHKYDNGMVTWQSWRNAVLARRDKNHFFSFLTFCDNFNSPFLLNIYICRVLFAVRSYLKRSNTVFLLAEDFPIFRSQFFIILMPDFIPNTTTRLNLFLSSDIVKAVRRARFQLNACSKTQQPLANLKKSFVVKRAELSAIFNTK